MIMHCNGLNKREHFLITALGDDWAPAVVDTPSELENIRQGHRSISDVSNFRIGGSTNVPRTYFDYSEYRYDNSGE